VPAENAKRLFWESYQRSVQREGVPRTETTPEVIPARRATASASRDPVIPTGAIRTDRDYWIPAFAGMTGVIACECARRSDPDPAAVGPCVMAGLVPAIHVLLEESKDVDARHKAGHDD
jgi:hypothetical protein